MEENTVASQESVEITNLRDLERKVHLTGTVVTTTLAGALVDIGMEVPGVVHISQLREEPVNRVEDVVKPGQTVEVWVRQVVPSKKRIELTMIEPLPLEWREISKDMVVKGKVTRIEKFGAFVDIGAERPGLVHISEITHDYIRTPNEAIKEGEEVEVIVLSVNRYKKQIKLSMKALEIREVAEVPREQPKKKADAKEAPEKEEPVPTAMELAIREAMERSKEGPEETAEKVKEKSTKKEGEADEILSRTLEQRVQTTK